MSRGAGRSAACPTCRKLAVRDGNQAFPFCGERCRLVDLGKWLSEEYRIAAEPDTSGGGAERLPNPADEPSSHDR